jgi:hypothetical protein
MTFWKLAKRISTVEHRSSNGEILVENRCCILAQFFTDVLTKQNKSSANFHLSRQSKSLKTLSNQRLILIQNLESYQLDDLPADG